MDLKKLNELLVPFKIEIVCENCTKKVPHSGKPPAEFPDPPCLPDTHHTDKKAAQKSPKTFRVYSHSKTQRQRNPPPRHHEVSQTARRPESTQVASLFPSHVPFQPQPRPAVPSNPPNLFLNLGTAVQDQGRRMSIQELLESSRNTPHKIEDVDPERFLYSDRKRCDPMHHLTHTTAQHLPFCPDESPISGRARSKRYQPETPVVERLALGGAPSREATPFRLVYPRESDTPSYFEQTPRPYLQFTPNMRGGIDPNEEGASEPFNLLENPFEKSL